ncbi:MAG: type II secretion system protein GspG [Prosthecobacter sp.]|nr:type II secretion system protein GspG [Prosthecobacter sp.]
MNSDHSTAAKPKVSRARKLMRLTFGLLIVIFLCLLIFMAVSIPSYPDGSAEITAAEAHMNLLKAALISYKVQNGRLPTTEEGLQALVRPPKQASFKKPLLSPSSILDPWATPYQYRTPAEDSDGYFDLWSSGPDKKNRTEDDIWSSNKVAPQ